MVEIYQYYSKLPIWGWGSERILFKKHINTNYNSLRMKNTGFHPSFLQLIYLILFIFLFTLIISTPEFIIGSVHFSERLIVREEIVKGILLGILFVVSTLILNLYKGEVAKHKDQIEKINTDKQKVEERLQISDQYIGMINVQIKEIKSVFFSIDNYPQTKADFKRTFTFFGEKVLGIVNSNWVLIRIVNSESQRTISEHYKARSRSINKYPQISNKLMIDAQPIASHTSIISNPKDIDILVFCVLPLETISSDEQIFLQAIIDEITKMYIIFNSSYFKNNAGANI